MQADSQMADMGFELGRDRGGAEPAVQEPDGVGLLLQDLHDGGVDVAGAGELAQQVALAGPDPRKEIPARALLLRLARRWPTPRRTRACSGMSRPSAIRRKTARDRTCCLPLMM